MTEAGPASVPSGRVLPDRFVRNFLRAAEEEVGIPSLKFLLSRAGLEKMIVPRAAGRADRPAIWDLRAGLSAGQYAGLQAVMRSYYGTGARLCLKRIGRRTWNQILREATIPQRTALFTSRLFPATVRLVKSLEHLAWQMQQDQDATIQVIGSDVLFVDRCSDSAFGQVSREPICWVTLGIIQSAMEWALGDLLDVEEVACAAMGAEACRFKIYQ